MAGDNELAATVALLRNSRWGALATVETGGQPYASAVAYLLEPDGSGILMHLSRLAPHTRNLLADPRASLVVSEPDSGIGDPQTLARVSLLGSAAAIPYESADYSAARMRYLQRLPDAARLFDFGDFQLFRLVPSEARFVGGFARARRFTAQALRQTAGS